MILFVFEGNRREKEIFLTMEYLFFPGIKDRIIHSYGGNIYDLYCRMTDGGASEDPLYNVGLLSILKGSGNPELADVKESDISETYLFFDYDLQHRSKREELTSDDLHRRLEAMLEFFDNETENGKLYINYPCVEAIRYTQALPDPSYHTYRFPISQLTSFKKQSSIFSSYKTLDFITFRYNRSFIPKNTEVGKALQGNWNHLIVQNLEKASFICTEAKTFPRAKKDVVQPRIFCKQVSDFYPEGYSIILSAFPLFLFDYFPIAKWRDGIDCQHDS